MARVFKLRFSAAVLLLILVTAIPCHAQGSSPTLPDFALVLESQSGHRKYKEPTAQDPLLRLRKVNVLAGDNRETLLRKNGLFVNANALMLFDLVNPQLDHQNPTLHSEISVPSILDNKSLISARHRGFRVKVVLYAKLKSEISALLDYGLCGAILAQYSDRVPEIRGYVNRATRSAKKLLNENRFTSENTLKMIKESLENRNGLLQAPCGADDDLKVYRLQGIANWLSSTEQATSTAQTSDVHVSVQTVGLDGKPYQNLEVYSRPEWLYGRERFPNLSSPSKKDLSVGDYLIEADGDPYRLYCLGVHVEVRPQAGVFEVTIRCQPRQ